MAKEKSRNFTFLLYPDGEGFPSDWDERLEKIGVPIAISPLHDKDKNKNRTDALDIFPYYSIHNEFRIVGSVVASAKQTKEKIIGFQNRCGITYGLDKPLFKILEGTGTTLELKKEGYNYKNFYATYLLGPLFIRNPHLTTHVIKNVIKSKNKKYKLKIHNRIPEVKAYKTYLENFNIKEA